MRHVEALSFKEIWKNTDDATKKRARKSRIRTIVPSRKSLSTFSFLVRSKEKYSDTEGWIFSVYFPDMILLNKKRQREQFNRVDFTPWRMNNVYITCTCPAWLYYGSAFHSTNRDYNLGDDENRAPHVRDPENEHYTCKHGIRVLNYLRKMGFKQLLKRFKKTSSHSASLFEVKSAINRALLVRAVLPEKAKNIVDRVNDSNLDVILKKLDIVPDFENIFIEDLFNSLD